MSTSNEDALTGVSKIWVKVRRTDSIYILTKVLSVGLAATFATITLLKKPLLQKYVEWNDSGEGNFELSLIYWLIFIYCSF